MYCATRSLPAISNNWSRMMAILMAVAQSYDETRFREAGSTLWFGTFAALGSQDVTLGYEAATESRSGGYPPFSLDIDRFPFAIASSSACTMTLTNSGNSTPWCHCSCFRALSVSATRLSTSDGDRKSTRLN